nr:acyltransferase [Pseudoduganella ginsengisoli]
MKQPIFLTDRKFFAPLHGLRGIAVLYVVVSHLGNGGLFLLPIPHDAIGKIGVWIFFALSAFLLTTHLCRDIESASSRVCTLLQYIIHRFFRIYPLYIIALIFHIIFGDISKKQLFGHLLLTQGRGELWAIPVEFQYYFIIPAIAISSLYLKKMHVCVLLVIALGAVLFYGTEQPASVFSNELNAFPKLAPFLLGSILALLHTSLQSRGSSFLIPLTCLMGLLVTTILYRCLAKGYLQDVFAPWLSMAIGASIVGLMYAILQSNSIGSLFAARPLVFLGEISFSVYLLHMFVIRAVVSRGHGLPGGIGAWISLSLCILCASISYWTIERIGIRTGRIIGQKLQSCFSPASTHNN